MYYMFWDCQTIEFIIFLQRGKITYDKVSCINILYVLSPSLALFVTFFFIITTTRIFLFLIKQALLLQTETILIDDLKVKS